MFDQSVSGIRTNLELFSQAASRVAIPSAAGEAPERSNNPAQGALGPELSLEKNRTSARSSAQAADAENAYRKAAAAGTSSDMQANASDKTNERNAAASREVSDNRAESAESAKEVDYAEETVKMMTAKQGVDANVAALKTAMSLSGQTVDILA